MFELVEGRQIDQLSFNAVHTWSPPEPPKPKKSKSRVPKISIFFYADSFFFGFMRRNFCESGNFVPRE
jgi:hypothetical protein